DGTAELAHTRRDSANPARRIRQSLNFADQLGVLFEHAGAEQIPFRGCTRRWKLITGGDAYRSDAELAGNLLCAVCHLAPEAARAVNDAKLVIRAALCGDMPQERLGVSARRRQHRDDMAGVRP